MVRAQLRYLLCLIVVVTSIATVAQQIPLYSQYYFNQFIYNPAQTSIGTEISASLIGRRQFSSLARPIETKAFAFQARSQAARSAFGLYAHQDQQNWTTNNSIQASYAYHIPLGNYKTLSFGIGIAAINQRFNQEDFHLIDPTDPSFTALINQNGTYIDGNAGVQMDFGNFQMGLSSLQILNENASYVNSSLPSLHNLAQHWMFNMNYSFDLGNEVRLDPYLLYRKTFGAPGQTDLNLTLNWKEKWYAGIAYRDGMSFSSMLGINIAQSMTIGYAYDITTHYQKSQLGNTHEVLLRWQPRRKTKDVQSDSIVIPAKPDVTAADTIEVEEEVIAETIIKDTIVDSVSDKEIIDVVEADTVQVDTPIKIIEPELPKDYYIIAGSFVFESSASTYVQQLEAKGIESFILKSSERFYVCVGKLDSKDEALAELENLSDTGLALWIKAILR